MWFFILSVFSLFQRLRKGKEEEKKGWEKIIKNKRMNGSRGNKRATRGSRFQILSNPSLCLVISLTSLNALYARFSPPWVTVMKVP